MDRRIIVFTDIGDTIIDEGTEVREVPEGVVYHAECIPGAREAMLELYEAGYPIVMVADGLVESFHNTMAENGLSHIFRAEVISEALGSCKPCRDMFQTAMDRLGLTEADKERVVMVGNNLERDIVGANRFGIRSVLLTWSERYRHEPKCAEEVPTYSIATPSELPTLIKQLDASLESCSP